MEITNVKYNEDSETKPLELDKIAKNLTAPKKVITIDIGGSSFKSAIALIEKDSIRLLDRRRVSNTDTSLDFFCTCATELVADYLKHHPAEINAIGISTSGDVNFDGVVERNNYIADYINFSWSEYLTTKFPAIAGVSVANDLQATSLGVSHCDENAPKSGLVFHVSVGSGIGAGITLNGRMMRGANGLLGNIAHTKVMSEEKRVCVCGGIDCLETYTSARAMKSDASKILGEKVGLSAIVSRLDEPWASELVTKAGLYLGDVLGGILNALNPNMITIGGGVMDMVARPDGENIFLDAVQKRAKETTMPQIARRSDIRATVLGNDAALFGAAILACVDHSERDL